MNIKNLNGSAAILNECFDKKLPLFASTGNVGR